MKTTILYGNGVILLKRNKQWRHLLLDIAGCVNLPEIKDNTLLYEYIVLPQPQYTPCDLVDCNGTRIMVSGKQVRVNVLTEKVVKKELEKKLVGGDSWFFDELANLKANHYLTTNYEFQLNNKFKITRRIEFDFNDDREDLLFGHEIGVRDGEEVTIWNIHGSIRNPESILLGMYEYSKYVVAINNLQNKEKREFNWVDLFMTTNVHIFGFGFGYEERDLWYVLTYRMRRIREGECFNNKIFYYAIKDRFYDQAKNMLLKAAGVEVVDIDFDTTTEDYDSSYRLIIEEYNKREYNCFC